MDGRLFILRTKEATPMFSLWISVLTLIVDLIALILNFVQAYKVRDGTRESKKTETIECEIKARNTDVLIRIFVYDDLRSEGKKSPHPVRQRDEADH